MTKWAELIGTFFYIGRIPRMPGTMGSLAGLALILVCAYFSLTPFGYFALTLILFFLGVISSNILAKELNVKDPQIVVVDEVVGMLISAFGLYSTNILLMFGAFVFFRIFDIWKPFFIRKVEKIPGGLGVMADDVVAGVFANICLRILMKVLSL